MEDCPTYNQYTFTCEEAVKRMLEACARCGKASTCEQFKYFEMAVKGSVVMSEAIIKTLEQGGG